MAEESPGGMVLDSAMRISSAHSSSLNALSITAAQRFLYSGSGGSEVSKLMRLHRALRGGGEVRNVEGGRCMVGLEVQNALDM